MTRLTFALLLSHFASSLNWLMSYRSVDAEVTLIGAVLVSKLLLVASSGGANAVAGSLSSPRT